jgi:tetratricopeptide (TPR) repeat protein
MRRINSEIITDFVSEKGYDRTNKTYFAYVPLENMVCFAVAEGFDGDGVINSAKLAVEAVLSAFEEKPSFRRIKKYIRYAHWQLKKHNVRNLLEAAITVAVSDYTRVRYAVCGNAKFYILNNNNFFIKSEDQTYFQYASKKYGMDKVSAKENRNLLQYLGSPRPPKPFVSKKKELPDGCTMILATQGIWERLHDIEIADACEEDSNPAALVGNIEELYLGYQMAGDSAACIRSYTVAAMLVNRTFKEDESKKRKRRRILIIIAVILVLAAIIATAAVLIMRANDRRTLSEIGVHNTEGARFSNFGNFPRAFDEYDNALRLVNRLNMRNRQYIPEKRAVSAEINDRWFLLRGIMDGEAFLDAGNHRAALRAFRSVEGIAAVDPDLELAQLVRNGISRANAYFELESFVLIGEMYEISGQYGSALMAYHEAADMARALGDLPLRRDVMLRIMELNQLIQELGERQVTAILDERERISREIRNEQEQTVSRTLSMAETATLTGDNALAISLYNQVLTLYGDMGISSRDPRYIGIVTIIAALEQDGD